MTPLLLPLLALHLCLGIALGFRISFPPVWLLASTLLLGGSGLWAARRGSLARAAHTLEAGWHPLVFLLAFCALALCAGLGLSTAALGRRVPACHTSRYADGRTVRRLVATVWQGPVPTARGHRVLLEAEALVGSADLCGRVELHLPPDRSDLVTGDRVLVRARLRPATGNRNPGAGSSRLRYRSADIGALAFAGPGSIALLACARGGGSSLECGSRSGAMLDGIRRRIRRLLDTASRGPARQILGALVLGEREAVAQQVRQAFTRAGVSHLLAVSGLHLTLMAGGLLWLLRRLLLRITPLARRTDVRRVAAPAALLAAVTYTALTGAAPSTVRACVMTAACLVGLCTSRAPDLVRPLSLAAVLLLVADPLDLFRPGFQLSFLAVAGIAIAVREARGAGRARGTKTARSGAGRGPLVWFGALARTTVVATLVTAPVVAYHFHQVSLAALLTNLVAIPLTTFVVLPLGLAGALLGLASPALGQPLLAAAGWSAARLHQICDLVSGSDLSVVRWSPGPLITLSCTTLVLGWLLRRRFRRCARAVLLLAALAMLVSVAGRTWRYLSPRLELTFLDVGQGDSTFVRLPGGATMLVDAGGTHLGRWDPGASRVVPFLEAQGVRRLDLVVASHPHPDHIGGLVAVLEAVEVGELWVCWHDEHSIWLERLLQTARRRRVRVAHPRVRRWGEATVRPLWPPGGSSCADPVYPANDNSIVLRLEYGAAAAILAGDVEQQAETDLARVTPPGQLRAQLLKVPHHGSSSSSSAAFLDAVSPRVAVVSCGTGNAFGFPHPAVLERYHQRGVDVARVDRLGAVVVELGRDGRLNWQGVVGH